MLVYSCRQKPEVEMVGWRVRNLISKEENIVLKIHETLIRPRIKYFTHAWAPVS